MLGAGGEKVCTTRLRIGQNCRAVCTKKSGLNALAIARDALLNDQHESAACFERRGLFFVIPVSSPVAMFKQSENVAIAHLEQLLAMRGVACAIIGTSSKFMPLPSAHAHGTNGQSCTARILLVHKLCLLVSMFCEHVLIMHTSHIKYRIIVIFNILVEINIGASVGTRY